jgi:hypothetical protein
MDSAFPSPDEMDAAAGLMFMLDEDDESLHPPPCFPEAATTAHSPLLEGVLPGDGVWVLFRSRGVDRTNEWHHGIITRRDLRVEADVHGEASLRVDAMFSGGSGPVVQKNLRLFERLEVNHGAGPCGMRGPKRGASWTVTDERGSRRRKWKGPMRRRCVHEAEG